MTIVDPSSHHLLRFSEQWHISSVINCTLQRNTRLTESRDHLTISVVGVLLLRARQVVNRRSSWPSTESRHV